VTIITWRTKLTLLTGATLIATGLLLTFAGPGASGAVAPLPAASPTPSAAQAAVAGQAAAPVAGDNGTVKIHNSGTAVTDRRNEPHVCVFYLDAFDFDANQSVTWEIKAWAPTGDRSTVVAGPSTLTLDSDGNGFTSDMTLANGHYKLFWTFDGEHGFAKQKVFWVSCGTPSSPPPGSPPPSCTENCSPSSPPPSCTENCGTPSSPPPSPSPSVEGSATSSQGAPSQGGLPITGWPLALIAGTGAVLVGTGGAAIVMARRRRGLHSSR